jgi:glycosyltransferase involved in cell wall biosynthesis
MVSPSLSAGGAERSVVLLTQGFQEKGHQVTVVTIADEGRDFYQLPEGTQRLALGLASDSLTTLNGLGNNLRRLRSLRRAIVSTKPHVVISHVDETNVLTSLALLDTGYPVIVVEHLAPRNSRSAIWRGLRRLTYPRVARVVSVSEGIQRGFGWLPERRKTILQNPIRIADDPLMPFGLDPSKKWIAAMGQLIERKGHDLLLKAFQKVASKHREWDLVILGDGNLRDNLKQLAERLELRDRVHLAGLVKNPFAVLRGCNLFVMASRSEGFPYALLEAMACGLPAIAMDCPFGPGDIICNGVDGLLVPNGDIDALAAAMDRLMSDEHHRDRLAQRAQDVSARFSLEKIIDRWEELFSQV